MPLKNLYKDSSSSPTLSFFPMSQNSMIREHPGLGTYTAGVYAPRDKLESGTSLVLSEEVVGSRELTIS